MYIVSWTELISSGALIGMDVDKSLTEPTERDAKNLIVKLLKKVEVSNISVKELKTA